jgi:hypothetical protein
MPKSLYLVLVSAFLLAMLGGSWSQQPSSQMQPSPNREGGGTNGQEKFNLKAQAAAQVPSVVDFISPYGLQKISAYCANKPDNEPDKWLHEKFICDVRITDVAIAVFTLLLALVTGPLIIVGWIQAHLLSKTAKRQLRAYVGADAPIFGKTDPNAISLTVRNGGQTPAANVRAWMNNYWIKGADQLLPGDFKYKDREPTGDFFVHRSVAALHPDKSCTFTFPLDDKLIPRVRKKEISLFFYGHVDYEDIFKRRQTTTFCYQYSVAREGDKIGHALGIWDEHNEAT